MNEYLNNIINEINAGQRTEIKDIDLTIEDFLYKDNTNKTLLEYLIINNITIPYTKEKIINESIEAAYIYEKYNKPLTFFQLDEKDLMQERDGKKAIDYFVEKNKLCPNLVRAFKTEPYIIDIISKDKTLVHYATYLDKNVINKLLTKDINEKYLIEKYLENEKFMKEIIEQINSPEIINILIQKNNKQLLKYANYLILMYKLEDNYTLLDDLLKNNIIPTSLSNIPEDIEYIKLLRERKLFQYLKDADESILLLKIDNKTLLEEIIEEGYEPKLNFIFEEETIKILYKLNKLEYIKNISTRLLLTNTNTLLDDPKLNSIRFIKFMLDLNINPLKNTFSINDEEIVNILYQYNYLDFLSEKVSKEFLLLEVENEKTLLEVFLEKNINFKLDFKTENMVEVAELLLKHENFILLSKMNINVLVENYNKEKTYLDYILKKIEKDELIHNLNENLYKYSPQVLAKYYIIIAKNNMEEYLIDLDEKKLLEQKENTNLLDEMLKLEPKLTINKLLSKKIKTNPKIVVFLKSRGYAQSDIDLVQEDKLYPENYLKQENNKNGIGPLLEETEILLNELNTLFINDGKSDETLINGLISGYRNALFINYELAKNEIQNLIEIKKNYYEDFCYIKSDDGAYFRPSTKSVYCSVPIIETILHETGHALHYFLAENKIPEDYKIRVEIARKNPIILEKIEKYAKKYTEIKKEIRKSVEDKYKKYFEDYYTEEKQKEIEDFLNKETTEKKETFKELEIPEETLDLILKESYTVEEYIDHQKRIFVNQYTEALLRTNYGSFMAIGDIIDSIFEGKLHSGVLKNHQGENIDKTCGHGIAYYYDSHNTFDEMIANFSAIVKSKESKEILELLKSIIGDEVYSMISNFYYSDIVLGTLKEKEEVKTL